MTTSFTSAITMVPSTVHLTGPADLVATMPYLVGVHPHDCLVAAFLRGIDGELVLTARVDHPAANDWKAFIDAWTRVCSDITGNNDVDRVVIVDFCTSGALTACASSDTTADSSADPSDDATTTLAHAMAQVAQEHGVYVCDEIVVAGETWRSLLCTDETCCPIAGSAVDPARGERLAATFVYEGVAPMPDRAAIADRVRPRPYDDPARMSFTAAVVSARTEFASLFDLHNPSLEQQRAEVARCARLLTATDETNTAPAIALMDNVRRRDALLRTLVHEVSAEERRCAEERVVAAVPLVDDDLRAPVATVAAGLAWQRGDGALAQECLSVALSQDPGYSLARLLQRAISQAVPPHVWVDAVGATTVDSCLHGS